MTLLETLIWYFGNIVDYALQMLPCMGLGLLLFYCLRPLRMGRLARLGLSSGPLREGALLLFILFCTGLAAVTLFPSYFWHIDHWYGFLRGEEPLFWPIDWDRQLQLLQTNLFQEIRRAFKGRWVMFLMVANIGIFTPVGFFPALLWRRPRWWKALLVGFGTSFFIEFVQFFIGRSSDVDDLILNTSGALAGYWIFCLFRALFPRLTAKFQCREREVPHHG